MNVSVRTSTVLTIIILSAMFPTIAATSTANSGELRISQGGTLDFNFIAYGDTRSPDFQGVSPVHESIVNAYLQQDPEFILHTGDMVGWGAIYEQWASFNDSMTAVWEAGIPFYGAAGNHEKYTSVYYQYDLTFTNYTTFFDYSSVIDEPGETELYYSFDYEGIHFIVLNTEDYFDDVEFGTNVFNCSEAQLTWLLADLSNIGLDDFVVAMFHRPLWSVRENRPDRWEQAETVRAEFHDLFVEYDVDLVFNGHDHYYYRTLRDGIYYVTTGGGGAELHGPDTNAPIWQSSDVAASEYHYCNVNVNSTHVTVDVMKTDDTTIDSFSIDISAASTTTTTSSSIPPDFSTLTIAIALTGAVVVVVVLVIFLTRRKAR
ncbi:MAG: metallophosphoesterase [Promethearchaeota archaeon]